jgi:mannosyl-3-phosphoglycerate synthase
VRAFDYEEISSHLRNLAVVVLIKGEKLKLLEGVLSGIPNECLVIIVSNSPRTR